MANQEKARSQKVRRAVAKLEQEGNKVQLLGRIKDGKLEIDQAGLDELAAKYPDAEMAFIALNSPFDPTPCTD